MANNDDNKKKKGSGGSWSSTKILDCVAFFAIICIAIALIFRLIFQNNNNAVASAFQSVGECLAYILCIWLSFYWVMRQYHGAWTKHNVWWLIAWIVAVVVIVVVYIVGVI